MPQGGPPAGGNGQGSALRHTFGFHDVIETSPPGSAPAETRRRGGAL